MTIHLNLSGGDPVALMHQLKPALTRAGKELRIELFGPGMLLADTALILFEILRNRPSSLQVHVHTWSCLSEGAVLLWLAGDTRSMRSDTWIEIPPADLFESASRGVASSVCSGLSGADTSAPCCGKPPLSLHSL